MAGSSIAIALVVVACLPGGDTSLYVKNETSAAWYVSVVQHVDGGSSRLWVVQVFPGADNFGLSWDGGETVAVSVLNSDCEPVGTFRSGENGTWVVDAVPGLTGTIEHHGAPFGSRTTTPGIIDTEDCGGVLAY
jgi:hypothetical protein